MLIKPLVSIITPTYNCEHFISETIISVVNQTYKSWEMLIVDDCSTDNTFKLIADWAERDSRIKIFQLDKNSGSGPARNLAIQKANGEIIAFLDGDDIWHQDKLNKHVRFMIDNDASFSHTSYGYMSSNGTVSSKELIVSDRAISYKDLLKRTEISCLTAMYNSKKIGKYYMPSIRRKQDYALWLSILKDGHKALPCNEVLAWYRQNPNSATSKKYKLIIKHYIFLRNHEKLDIYNSLKFTFHWLKNGVLRYYL